MADDEDEEVVIIDEEEEEEEEEGEEEAPPEDMPRVTSAGASEPLAAPAVEDAQPDGEAAQAADAAEAPQEPAAPEKPLEEVQAEFQVALVAFWLARGQAPPVIGVTWWRHDSMNLSWAIWFAVQRHGGYDHVTENKLWRTCADSLARVPPRDCTTISYQVKQAYEKALLPFERSPDSTAAAIPASARVHVVGRGGGGGSGKPRASKPRAPGTTTGAGTRHRSARNRGFASSDEASSGDDVAAGGRDAKGAMTFVTAPGDPRPARTKRAAAMRAGWTTRFDTGDFLDSYDVDVDTLWSGQRHPGDAFAEAAPHPDGYGGDGGMRFEEPPARQQEWVLCDACRKWRRLPRGVAAESLPPKWLCEQATWRVTLPAQAMPGLAAATRLKLCCIVPEYNQAGEPEAMSEAGAPEVTLTDNLQWLFAYDSVEAATNRGRGGAAAAGTAE